MKLNQQFIKSNDRPEELLSPVFSIVICTIVQIFLATRCIQFMQITGAPATRGSWAFRVRLLGVGAVLGTGIVISSGSGLGMPIQLHVSQYIMDLTSRVTGARG
jgi:hypothetical protein